MKSSDRTGLNLAFVDPGRRKAPYFLELRHRLAPRVRCVYYSHRVIVRGYVRSARASLFPGPGLMRRRFDISDAELQNAIGEKEMRRRGHKHMGRARRLLFDLQRFYDSRSVDAILVWNGSNLIVALAVYLARRRGLPVIFAEHGYLPGTMQLDLRGVNFDSSITALVASGEAALPADAALDLALDRDIASYKSGQPMRVMNREAPAVYSTDARSWLYRKVGLWLTALVRSNPPSVGLDEPELPQRFVLLPFQVRKDSQLMLHSPVVGNDMPQLLDLLRSALAVVDPQMQIVVKLHPNEHWNVQARYAPLIRAYPDVLFIRRHRMTELLQKTAAVVTVNSTVGFEAFLFDKPVVALGRNFYTAPGLVEMVGSAEQLPGALRRALSGVVDVERRRAMLRYVHARFLTFGIYHDYSETSLRATADRIESLLGVSAADPAVEAAIELS